MEKLTLKDLPLEGKCVLMRVDFNVPLDSSQNITDDSRILASLPSIQYILNHGASLILMSHLGRPDGKFKEDLSLAPVAKRLSELLKKPVPLAPDCIGPAVEKMAKSLQPKDVLLLENLRFHPEEEAPEKDFSFVSKLAELGDYYVNDAFGTAHRAHASTALIAKQFPHKAAMGFLMQSELEALGPLLHTPDRPFYALLGGAKVSTKAGVIQNLLKIVNALFLGGGMSYTFLKAQNISIGDSLYEPSELQTAKEILLKWGKKIHLPVDLVIADAFSNDAKSKVILASEGIPAGWQGMGIGPETVKKWSELLGDAETVFWNGPLDVFEMPRFSKGTEGMARFLSQMKAKVIVGGGDSLAAVHKFGLSQKFTHLSTGGGAALEFLEYGHLPGIDALSERT